VHPYSLRAFQWGEEEKVGKKMNPKKMEIMGNKIRIKTNKSMMGFLYK